ncbi:uncharacterized protein [Porites lutea]|uniref:uncharacterized protein n=1 Tax=Porites lutea TaxID=51062 RepID=UPI003CC6C338
MAFPVIGRGGQRYELHEGMKQNFLSLYGEWENGSIMCPSVFPRDFISPVSDLPGVAPLEQHVLHTIRGDDAEEKIFEILKRFGEEEKQPMFVLTKLKITELFMKYCMPDQTFQELKKLSEKKKKETEKKPKKLDVEIDFAIVHLKIGVILVEVKATDKWPNSKAFNQLSEGEKIIKGLLHEDSHIPVYKVVALPSMDGSGNSKDDFLILKKADVGSCEEFSRWMHSYFNAEKCGSQEKQELRNLLYKLVGERTRVDSSFERFSDNVHPEKVLSERCKNIWSQACLRQRYEFECSKRKEKGKKPTGDKRKLDEVTKCSTAEEKGKTPTAGKRKLDELTECSTAEEKGKKPTGDKRKLDELAECSIAEEKGKKPTADKRKLDGLPECSTAEEKGKKPTGDKRKLDGLPECSIAEEKREKPTADKRKLDGLPECSIAEEKGKKPTADKRKLDGLPECSTAEEKGKKPTGDKRKLDELAECSTAKEKGKKPTADKRKLDGLPECSTAEEKGKKPTGDKRKLDEVTECSTAEEKGKKSMRLVKTADEPGLAVMAKDIVFLNPEQLCIFEGSIHQLISGAPGTGKTILLQYKALECVRKGEKVIIFVPPPLNKKYEAFFEEKEASSGVSIYTWEDFANLVPESEEKFHLFVDELQILFANKKHLEFHLVSLVKKQKNFDNCYCWFAYDETQALKTWDLDLLTHSDILKFRAAFLGFIVTITDLNDQEKTRNYKFVESHLKTVMRSTEQVFEFVKKFAHKTGFYSKMLSRKEQLYKSKHGDDVPPFLKELWQGTIGHRVGGYQVEEVETDSLEMVLESILGEVHVNRQKLKEVAVLVTSDWMLEDLSSMCKNVGIPLCAVGEAKDALVLDHGGKAHSFEWPVVIAVCERGLHHHADPSMLKYYNALWFLIFSRAVVKLVVFNVTGHLKNLMRRRCYRNPQPIGPGEGL